MWLLCSLIAGKVRDHLSDPQGGRHDSLKCISLCKKTPKHKKSLKTHRARMQCLKEAVEHSSVIPRTENRMSSPQGEFLPFDITVSRTKDGKDGKLASGSLATEDLCHAEAGTESFSLSPQHHQLPEHKCKTALTQNPSGEIHMA